MSRRGRRGFRQRNRKQYFFKVHDIMSVYVDDTGACVPNARWRWSEKRHLVADSREELIEFAIKMGLKPGWFQDRAELPHFDLTKGMRYQALRHGADTDYTGAISRNDS